MIAVEGCIGAGKSTVARALAAVRGVTCVLERFEENPFLSEFYKDPEGTVIETEFSFLLLHYRQLKELKKSDGGREAVADFSFAKDLLYADMNIRDAGYSSLFHQLYRRLAAEVGEPDVTVCLSASDELISRRIALRNRAYEQTIDFTYYSALNARYTQFFESISGRKVLVNMDEMDFISDPALADALSQAVDSELVRLG